MTQEMQIKLSQAEILILEKQCQFCRLWNNETGCCYYPLTPDFADNRPVEKCLVFEAKSVGPSSSTAQKRENNEPHENRVGKKPGR
jgi:hypothetical protein